MGKPYYKKGKAEGHWVKAIEDSRCFDSVAAAAREYNVTRAAIYKALKEKVCAGGVHWEEVAPEKAPKVLLKNKRGSAYKWGIEVYVNNEQYKKLCRAAAERGATIEEVIQELIDSYEEEAQ